MTKTGASIRTSWARRALRACGLATTLALTAAMFAVVPAFATGVSPGPGDDDKTCPTGTDAISTYHYTVNGNPVVDLNQNNVHAGDVVVAHFTIAAGCKDVKVTFASYNVPPGGFVDKTLQVLFSHETGSFSAGEHSEQVTLPCSWQADLAIGDVIEHLGKPDYYGSRLKNSGTGTDVCETPSPTSSVEASSTPAPSGSPTGGVNSSATPSSEAGVLAASVTNPNTGNGTQAFGGFVAVMMVLTGIAILAEVRRRRLRD